MLNALQMPAQATQCPTSLQHPDLALIRAGVALKLAWEAFKALPSDTADDVWEAACARAAEPLSRIEALQARTPTGVAVKAYAVAWCHIGEATIDLHDGHDMPATDTRLATSIVRELVALDWQAMAIAEGVEMEGLGYA